MRRFFASLWVGFLWLSRLGVAWLPPLIILGMGLLYLFNCYQVLAAPGTGFRLLYQAEGGVYSVVSGRYSIDPVAQVAQLSDVVVRDPAGKIVGQAKQVTALLSGPSPRVRVSQAEVTLVRSTDGAIDLLRALPKADPSQPDSSLSMEIDQVRLTVVDRSQAPEMRQMLVARDLRLATGAGHSLAAGRLEWPNGGVIPVEAMLRKSGEGSIKFQLENFDGSKVIPWIPRLVDRNTLAGYENLSATSLRLTGPGEVTWKPGEPPVFLGSTQVAGTGVTVGKTLRGATLKGTVRTDGANLRVTADVRESGRSAIFDGVLGLGQKFTAAGNVDVSANSSSNLWPELATLLPKGTAFRGVRYRGWISTDGQAFATNGELLATSLSTQGEEVQGVKANLATDGKTLRAEVATGSYKGQPFSGSLAANLTAQTLEGRFEAGIGSNFFRDQEWGKKLRGEARAIALVTGKFSDPTVSVEARGQVSYQLTDDRLVVFGPFLARGKWVDNQLQIERVDGESTYGRVTGVGSFSFENGFDITLSAYGVDLRRVDERLGGTAYVQATIRGTTEQPVLTARVEAYRAKFNDVSVPLVTADVSATSETLAISKVIANFGSGSVVGQAVVALASGAIEGRLQSSGLNVSEFAEGDLNVRVALDEAVISGTLEKPLVAGRVSVGKALIAGVPLDGGSATFQSSLEGGTLSNGLVRIGEGTVSGEGTFVLKDRFSLALSGKAVAVPLAPFLPPDAPISVDIEGTAGGDYSLTVGQDRPLQLTVNGRVNQVGVSGTLIGSGPVRVALKDEKITASGQIGSLSRYILVRDAGYDLKAKKYQGEVEVSNFFVEDIVETFVPVNADMDPQLMRALRQLTGRISALATVSGQDQAIDFDLKSLTTKALEIDGQPLGELTLKATKTGDQYNLVDLSFRRAGEGKAESVITGSGVYRDKGGPIDATLSIVNYDLGIVSALFPDSPLAAGKLNSTIVVAGTSDAPIARFSLDLAGLGVRNDEGGIVELPITVTMAPITYRDKAFSGKGKAIFRGLEGEIDLKSIPLGAFAETPDGVAEASIAIKDLTLARINQELNILDPDASSGKINALLTLKGNRNGTQVSGKAELQPEVEGQNPVVKFAGTTQLLSNVKLAANLADNKLSLDGSWESGESGRASVTGLADLATLLGGRMAFADAWEQLPISAQFEARDYIVSVLFPKASRDTTTVLNGKLNLAGNPTLLTLGGDLNFKNTTVHLPPVFPEAGPSQPGPVALRFNSLTYRFDENSTLILPTGRLKALGNGVIEGSLAQPEFRGDFLVSEGQVRTATNRIFIDQGAVTFTYSGATNRFNAITDLKGRTTATVRQSQGNFRTYRIDVSLKGDLVSQTGLSLSGTSDPPDLSPEDIRAVLGERTLFQDVVAGLQGGNQDVLRSSFYQVAVPSLTDFFTQALAQELGLDYLAFDYNPFDGPVLLAGKRLGKGFSFEGSRQLLTEGVDRVKFDVRLTYRVPTPNPFITNLRWGLGFDQDTPWRISVDYSVRF